MLRSIGLALAAGLGAVTFAQGQTAQPPARIDVVATDYAFGVLPAVIAAGPTVFSFANHGKVQHEMAIVRLRDGVTVDDLVKLMKEGGRRREVVERSVGNQIAGPGKSPDGKLLVDLIRGASYVVLCNLKNTPDSPGHTMLGMYKTFRPQ
jgi:uncharacterized cupredoxin-like copper-binding protein